MRRKVKIVLGIIVLAMANCLSSFAAHGGKEVTFKVSGNCSMCEKKIETAAMSLKGVKSADWDVNKKTIRVIYEEHKVGLQEIKIKIAAVGYDAGGVTATQEAYDRLPECCRYKRQ